MNEPVELNYSAEEINSILGNSEKMYPQVGEAPAFEVRTSENPYKKYNLVSKDGYMYRCNVDSFYGAWNAASWIQTTALGELTDMRGITGYENLKIQFSVNKGDGVVAGKTLTISFTSGSQSETVQKTIGADGSVTMLIPSGDVYQIIPTSLTGYMILPSPVLTASMSNRTVNMKYIQKEPGFYAVLDDGTLINFDAETWDHANDSRVIFSKYIDSNTQSCPIYIPKVVQQFSAVFSPDTTRDYTTIPNRTSTTCKQDFTGKAQAEAWVAEAQSQGYVELFNQETGRSYTIDTYLPAIRTAFTKKVQNFLGQDIYGYLGSFGQYWTILQNLDLYQLFYTTIGSSFPNLRSGYFWSSSECNSYSCWILGYGTVYNLNKDRSLSVVVLFDVPTI